MNVSKQAQDLSIIIGTHNTKKLLKNTLTSLQEMDLGKIRYEIIVIDDCSNDNTSDMLKSDFPFVSIIRNARNLGYSKSYNKGTKQALGKYILHLNSDVLFSKTSSLVELIHFMDNHKNIGIAGCRILKQNGRLDLPCKRSFPTLANVFFQTVGLARLFPSNKFFGNYYLGFLPERQLCEVDCIMGAFMLIRKEVFTKIGLLDERFFMYGEDIDFCFRAKRAGWKVLYYPKIVIKHVHGGSTKQNSWKYIWMFHGAMFLYYRKHVAKKTFFAINAIIYLAIVFRFLSLLLFSILEN